MGCGAPGDPAPPLEDREARTTHLAGSRARGNAGDPAGFPGRIRTAHSTGGGRRPACLLAGSVRRRPAGGSHRRRAGSCFGELGLGTRGAGPVPDDPGHGGRRRPAGAAPGTGLCGAAQLGTQQGVALRELPGVFTRPGQGSGGNPVGGFCPPARSGPDSGG